MNNLHIYHTKRYRTRQKGAVVIIAVIFFLVISLALVMAVTGPIAEQVRASSRYLSAAQSYVVAEALNDDALYMLNSGRTLPSTLGPLSLNGATSTASILDLGTSKQITTSGNDNNARRSVKSTFSQAVGASFNYGLQTGTGGISLVGGAGINGSVYSNGDITGSSGTFVTGAAYVANRSDPSLDQYNGISGSPTSQLDFGGKIIYTDTRPPDAAQSFTVSTTTAITSLSLYLKRYSSAWAEDVTVRIVNNSAGSPGGTTLASISLPYSSVPTTQAFVEIPLSTPLSLTPGTTYWIVLDTPNSWWNNYYSWGATSNTYSNGVAKVGTQGGAWSAASPSDADAFFKLYLGGDTGTITGITIGSAGGDGHAYEIANATISGSNIAYCKIASGSTNKACNTSEAEPSQEAMPLADSLIQEWKDDATAGTIRNSSWSIASNVSTSTSGATKINGNLTLGGAGILTINGTLYVTGNISLGSGAKIILGSSYGTSAGVVVVDGTTDLSGGGLMTGNGNTGSYMILVSTNTNCASGVSCTDYAIDASGGAGSVVLSAQKGGIHFAGGASAKAAVGNFMYLEGGTTLNYESGLANVSFASGPGGTWSVSGWDEIAQ